MTPRTLAALVLLGAAAMPAVAAFAQQAGLNLQQIERKYPRMSPIHIEKCNRDGDGIYTRAEMACVEGIYSAMYQER